MRGLINKACLCGGADCFYCKAFYESNKTKMPEDGCLCDGWKENLKHIHGQFNFYNDSEYTGEIFSFCPWCGKELKTVLSNKHEISDNPKFRDINKDFSFHKDYETGATSIIRKKKE